MSEPRCVGSVFSSLDYPGKWAVTLFFPGCNLRCPYCHNPSLVRREVDASRDPVAEVKRHLPLAEAVVASGGEPSLHSLEGLFSWAKEEDLAVGLHTNGTLPGVVLRWAEEGLLDWVGVDVKTVPGKGYAVGWQGPLEAPLVLVDGLGDTGVQVEARTTVHPAVVSLEELHSLLERTEGKVVRHVLRLPRLEHTLQPLPRGYGEAQLRAVAERFPHAYVEAQL